MSYKEKKEIEGICEEFAELGKKFDSEFDSLKRKHGLKNVVVLSRHLKGKTGFAFDFEEFKVKENQEMGT